MPETHKTAILKCDKITKSFGSLEILKGVDIEVYPGERRAILGPNGAGKTTLFNIISGELPMSSGKIYINGEDVTKKPSYSRVRYGLARTFQISNLFFDLTVVENIILGIYGSRQKRYKYWRPVRLSKDIREQAMQLLRQFSLEGLANEKVRNLSHGDQRLLEIILGMSSKPKILALDEPSSGLSIVERQRLAQVIKKLDKDLTLIVIEHDMDLVAEIADTVTVLNYGVVCAEGSLEDIKGNNMVRDVYMGVDDGC
jgi:branched-chain amino acid transport system ATP-binding protein